MTWGPIASIIPLALGVAISPLPVVAMLVLLLTKGARRNSLVMLACWVLATGLAIGVAIAFAGHLPQPKHGTDIPAEWVFASLVGLALIATAAISYLGRRNKPQAGEPPAWLNRVDDLTPWGGAVVAISNATTSPKNLALTLTAGLVISRASTSLAETGASAVIYVLIASVLVAAPVVMYFVGGNRAREILSRWKDRITAHASAFIEIVLLVIGIAMAARGISNLLH